MEKQIIDITPLRTISFQKKRVAAYARVSCDKDAMLHSLAAQIDYYRKYIKRRPEWEFAGVYADEAKTGTKDDREQFQKLLSDCRSGLVDMVITKSVSRFARNTVTLLSTARSLKELGVNVYFEDQNINSISDEGELMLSILASYAQEESLSVSENCKWYLRQRMKDGYLVGIRDMFGYNIERGVVTINESEAAIVRMVFREYNSGASTAALARELENANVPRVSGGRWTAARIRDMLKNEKYKGDALQPKKFVADHLTKRLVRNHGELDMYYVQGTHEAIVDEATYNAAQERLAANYAKTNVKRPNATRYPLSGKIVCGNCGKHYSHKTTHGKVAWQCVTFLYRGKALCAAKQIPEDVLYGIICESLGIDEFDEELFEERVKELRITAPNEVKVVFADGRSELHAWKDRSRSESWTDEMREAARHQKAKGGASTDE